MKKIKENKDSFEHVHQAIVRLNWIIIVSTVLIFSGLFLNFLHH